MANETDSVFAAEQQNGKGELYRLMMSILKEGETDNQETAQQQPTPEVEKANDEPATRQPAAQTVAESQSVQQPTVQPQEQPKQQAERPKGEVEQPAQTVQDVQTEELDDDTKDLLAIKNHNIDDARKYVEKLGKDTQEIMASGMSESAKREAQERYENAAKTLNERIETHNAEQKAENERLRADAERKQAQAKKEHEEKYADINYISDWMDGHKVNEANNTMLASEGFKEGAAAASGKDIFGIAKAAKEYISENTGKLSTAAINDYVNGMLAANRLKEKYGEKFSYNLEPIDSLVLENKDIPDSVKKEFVKVRTPREFGDNNYQSILGNAVDDFVRLFEKEYRREQGKVGKKAMEDYDNIAKKPFADADDKDAARMVYASKVLTGVDLKPMIDRAFNSIPKDRLAALALALSKDFGYDENKAAEYIANEFQRVCLARTGAKVNSDTEAVIIGGLMNTLVGSFAQASMRSTGGGNKLTLLDTYSASIDERAKEWAKQGMAGYGKIALRSATTMAGDSPAFGGIGKLVGSGTKWSLVKLLPRFSKGVTPKAGEAAFKLLSMTNSGRVVIGVANGAGLGAIYSPVAYSLGSLARGVTPELGEALKSSASGAVDFSMMGFTPSIMNYGADKVLKLFNGTGKAATAIRVATNIAFKDIFGPGANAALVTAKDVLLSSEKISEDLKSYYFEKFGEFLGMHVPGKLSNIRHIADEYKVRTQLNESVFTKEELRSLGYKSVKQMFDDIYTPNGKNSPGYFMKDGKAIASKLYGITVNPKVLESAKMKLLTAIGGGAIATPTITRSEIVSEYGEKGKEVYTVRTYTADGKAFSERDFGSLGDAKLEETRLGTVIKRNNVAIAEGARDAQWMDTCSERATRAVLSELNGTATEKELTDMLQTAFEKDRNGEQLTDGEKRILKRFDEVYLQNLRSENADNSSSVRRDFNKSRGVDIDKILAKDYYKWSESEREAVDEYIKALNGENTEKDMPSEQTEPPAPSEPPAEPANEPPVVEAEKGGQQEVVASEKEAEKPSEETTGKDGVGIEDYIKINKADDETANDIREDAENYTDEVNALRAESEQAVRYSNGESSEKPEHWDYWKEKFGLDEPKAKTEEDVRPMEEPKADSEPIEPADEKPAEQPKEPKEEEKPVEVETPKEEAKADTKADIEQFTETEQEQPTVDQLNQYFSHVHLGHELTEKDLGDKARMEMFTKQFLSDKEQAIKYSNSESSEKPEGYAYMKQMFDLKDPVKQPKGEETAYKKGEELVVEHEGNPMTIVVDAVGKGGNVTNSHVKSSGEPYHTNGKVVFTPKEKPQEPAVKDWVDDTASEARKRGYRIVNGQKVERQGALSEGVDVVYGDEHTTKFSQNDKPTTRFAVVSAKKMQPSHIRGQRNPAFFNDEGQPKNRTDQVSVAREEEIAKNIDPEEITVGVTAYQGAPTINSRGEVIQGNNRAAALREMYSGGYGMSVKKYKQFLKDNAKMFGLTPEDIDRIEDPVLVNVADVTDAEAIRLGQLKATDNESGGVQFIEPKPTVQKLVGANKLTRFMDTLLDSENPMDSIKDLIRKNGVKALKFMRDMGIINETQYNSAFNAKDTLSSQARSDLEGVIRHAMFDGGPTGIEEMFDHMPDAAQKGILETIARDFSSDEQSRIKPVIQESILAYHNAVSTSKEFANAKTAEQAARAMRNYARQVQLIGEEQVLPEKYFSKFALLLAERYRAYSKLSIKAMFNELYDKLQGVSESSGDLFAGEVAAEKLNINEAFKKIFNYGDTELQRGDVLGDTARTGEKGEPGSEGGTGGRGQDKTGERGADGQGGTGGTAEKGSNSLIDTASKAANKARLQKAEDYSAFAEQYGLDAEDVAMYAEGMKKGSTSQAMRARAMIGRKIIAAHEGEIHSLMDVRKFRRPVEEALKEKFGDVDKLLEEYRNQVEDEHKAMEAARKKAQEEEAKRKAHLEELSLLSDDEIDRRYMEALDNGNEVAARDMLDEAARRKGYADTDSEYQGVGAWVAPSNPGYESDEARRADVEDNAPDVNLEDMALGYSQQPDDYFTHPERYSQNTPHGLESARSIQAALEALKRGEKGVKVKVYRAVPISVMDGKLRNGDWVTPSKKYAEMHGNSRLKGKYRIIEDEVPANELWWDGNDANEWGYDNGKEYKYKNAKNNRKLNDLVVRDDNGNVIVPSKRFNQRKADERYQIGMEGVKPSKAEVALRDAVIDRLRENGMEVISDVTEGQKVLDMVNGKDARPGVKRMVLKILDTLAGNYENSSSTNEITDYVRFFRTANGEAYGFTVGGKIYIDPKIATSETPVHEYAHLWASALRSGNPKEWQNVVGLMKGTSVWEEVKKRYSELNTDDDIADEVIATYSGRRGAERLREEAHKVADGNGDLFEKAEAISALGRIKESLKKFWKGVCDFLHIHYKSAEEVADRVMKDLLDGVDTRKMGKGEAGARFSAKQKRALETVSASHNGKHQPTVVSSADGAKILNELERTIEKYKNISNRANTFIGDVAKALGASRFGSSSEYATFEAMNGDVVTIRLANHNAHVSGFNHNGKDNGISIVISPKPNEGLINDGDAHIVEFYYDSIKLRRAEGKPLAEIVRSIKQALYSGEFKDTTGLAERQEVNGEDVVRYQLSVAGRKANGGNSGYESKHSEIEQAVNRELKKNSTSDEIKAEIDRVKKLRAEATKEYLSGKPHSEVAKGDAAALRERLNELNAKKTVAVENERSAKLTDKLADLNSKLIEATESGDTEKVKSLTTEIKRVKTDIGNTGIRSRYKAKISEIKSKSENVSDLAKSLVKYISGELSPILAKEMGKAEFNALVRSVRDIAKQWNAKDGTEQDRNNLATKLDDTIRKVDDVIVGIETRKLINDLADMLSVKTTKKDSSGKKVGVKVSNTVRIAIETLKGMFRGFDGEFGNGLKSLVKSLDGMLAKKKSLQGRLKELELSEASANERLNSGTITKDEYDAEIEAINRERDDVKSEMANFDTVFSDALSETNDAIDTAVPRTTEEYNKLWNDLMAKQQDEQDGVAQMSAHDKEMLKIMPFVRSLVDVRELFAEADKSQSRLKALEEQWKSDAPTPTDTEMEAANRRDRRLQTALKIREERARLFAAKDAARKALRDLNNDVRSLLKIGKTQYMAQQQERLEHRSEVAHIGIAAVDTGKERPAGVKGQQEAKESEDKSVGVLRRLWNWVFLAPTESAESMLSRVDVNHFSGEGELYHLIMESERGYSRSEDRRIESVEGLRSEIQSKCKELFGSKKPKDGNKKIKFTQTLSGEPVPAEVTKGEALSLYLWSLSEEGRAKLESQGIDAFSISEIKAGLGDNWVKFGEWVVGDFLPKLYDKYNEKYVEKYGTEITRHENYFPFKIYGGDIVTKDELESFDNGNTIPMPSALKERVKHNYQLSTTEDALKILNEHVAEMEDWYHFADMREDISTLLSSRAFRETLKLQGPNKWRKFRDAMHTLAGVDKRDESVTSQVINEAQSMYASSAVGFRYWTALKQLQSMIAGVNHSYNPRFQARLFANILMPVGTELLAGKVKNVENTFAGMVGSCYWAWKNLPQFRERYRNGKMGNIMLEYESVVGNSNSLYRWIKKNVSQKGLFLNQVFDAAAVAVYSKSIYDYEYTRLIRKGATEEDAHKYAMTCAETNYNKTQQSSGRAYVSKMQVSGNPIEKGLTTFQTASLGFMRKSINDINDIQRAYRLLRLGKEKPLHSISKGAKATVDLLWDGVVMPASWNLINVIGVAGFYYGAKAIFNALFGGDDDNAPTKDATGKTALDRFIEGHSGDVAFATISAPLQGTILNNLVNSAWSGYGGWTPTMAEGAISEVLRSAGETLKGYKDSDSLSDYLDDLDEDAAKYTIKTVLYALFRGYTGIDMKTVERFYNAFYDYKVKGSSLNLISAANFLSTPMSSMRDHEAKDYYLGAYGKTGETAKDLEDYIVKRAYADGKIFKREVESGGARGKVAELFRSRAFKRDLNKYVDEWAEYHIRDASDATDYHDEWLKNHERKEIIRKNRELEYSDEQAKQKTDSLKLALGYEQKSGNSERTLRYNLVQGILRQIKKKLTGGDNDRKEAFALMKELERIDKVKGHTHSDYVKLAEKAGVNDFQMIPKGVSESGKYVNKSDIDNGTVARGEVKGSYGIIATADDVKADARFRKLQDGSEKQKTKAKEVMKMYSDGDISYQDAYRRMTDIGEGLVTAVYASEADRLIKDLKTKLTKAVKAGNDKAADAIMEQIRSIRGKVIDGDMKPKEEVAKMLLNSIR